MKFRLVPWVPAAIWAAVLFFASSQSELRVDLVDGRDKIAHFFAYLVLGVLLAALAAQYVIDGLRGSFFG